MWFMRKLSLFIFVWLGTTTICCTAGEPSYTVAVIPKGTTH